jgi:hypothetical protein
VRLLVIRQSGWHVVRAVDKTEADCSASASTINVGARVEGDNVDTTMEKREDGGKKIWRYLGNSYSVSA